MSVRRAGANRRPLRRKNRCVTGKAGTVESDRNLRMMSLAAQIVSLRLELLKGLHGFSLPEKSISRRLEIIESKGAESSKSLRKRQVAIQTVTAR